MENLLSFTSFTDHVKSKEQAKINEEQKHYRKKIAEAFKNLIEELGITKLSELDEAKKKKMWETLFNEEEMDRLSGFNNVNEYSNKKKK
jgi:hypothetical protein